MRFVQIASGRNTKNLAGLDLGNGKILKLCSAVKRWGASFDLEDFGHPHNSCMLSFLRSTEARPDIIASIHNKINQDISFLNDSDIVNLNHNTEYKLSAPIIPDRNVFCIGKNYSDHIDEINRAEAAKNKGKSPSNKGQVTPAETIKVPVIFTKAPQTIVEHLGEVECHSKTTRWLDYEVELAVIIGKTTRDISEEHAMDSVFGYTIANDITARDIQKRHLQWFKGKSLDTSCPLGPSILHAATNPHINPHNLGIKTLINNEIRQNSNTSNLIFKIPKLICELSKGFTLLPGDIILTGTPEGVGYAMDPPQVLLPGDHMSLEIEHIGKLENYIVA